MSETRGDKKQRALSIRLPDDVYGALVRIADQEDRSLNQQALRCIRECISKYQPAQRPPDVASQDA
jgi:hypothetical protein